jgi:hypothetical protein
LCNFEVNSDLNLGPRLDKKITPNYFAASKPTSSSGVKEDQEDYGDEEGWTLIGVQGGGHLLKDENIQFDKPFLKVYYTSIL